jgi:hypothetical protein
MKSKLIALGAAGALMMALIPVAAAANDIGSTTVVSVTVSEGTTIFAPAAFSIGTGIPGVTVTSSRQVVEWYSNATATKYLGVILANLANGGSSIPAADVKMALSISSTPTYGAYAALDTSTKLSMVPKMGAGCTTTPGVDYADVCPSGDTRGSEGFLLQLLIPTVPANTYSGTMTFSVN